MFQFNIEGYNYKQMFISLKIIIKHLKKFNYKTII